ncbi:hypothetical protein ABZ923_40490 [Streptomyces sp. NPDC046881]|uniref:hypothetical protein n=1 Tax=Streptomyces sp. NPDC046881 TaxID=3155374 RepID=UPI0033D23472
MENLSGNAAVAAALAHLLSDHPELSSMVWPVGETTGVLAGHQIAETGRGEIIDTCAEIMGGTVARSMQLRGAGDGQGLAQLVTTFDGVPVEVWASYPLEGGQPLTGDELREILGLNAPDGGEDQ